jgi:hypothetical protein
MMLPCRITVTNSDTYANLARLGFGLIQAPRYRLTTSKCGGERRPCRFCRGVCDVLKVGGCGGCREPRVINQFQRRSLMSIATKSPISVAAALVALLLSAPSFSRTPVQADAASSSAGTMNPDEICICFLDHCLCLSTK